MLFKNNSNLSLCSWVFTGSLIFWLSDISGYFKIENNQFYGVFYSYIFCNYNKLKKTVPWKYDKVFSSETFTIFANRIAQVRLTLNCMQIRLNLTSSFAAVSGCISRGQARPLTDHSKTTSHPSNSHQDQALHAWQPPNTCISIPTKSQRRQQMIFCRSRRKTVSNILLFSAVRCTGVWGETRARCFPLSRHVT